MFNLRGNQRTSGELSRKEGGKIFGSGSRTPIAITILVRKPNHIGNAAIHYEAVTDYLSREEKLSLVSERGSMLSDKMGLSSIAPNEAGDWINQRDGLFETFIPLGDKESKSEKTFFVPLYSCGIQTNRDTWAYNFSATLERRNARFMVETYNDQVEAFGKAFALDRNLKVEDFVLKDEAKIKWSSSLLPQVSKGHKAAYSDSFIVESMYRPFCKQHLYNDSLFIHRPYQIPRLFPTPQSRNVMICVPGIGTKKGFMPFIVDTIPDVQLQFNGQCFPLYYYEKHERDTLSLFDNGGDEYIRRDAISDFVLHRVREEYGPRTTKEDVFYYVYGLLHAREYRERFASDLQKSLPRLPLVEDTKAFKAFAAAGRKLAALHLNYESVEQHPSVIIENAAASPNVQQMRFGKTNGKEDRSVIVYNDKIRILNIPLRAYDWQVNGKSPIEWIMERYAVTVNRDSQIRNDPNDRCREHGQPRYILDLIGRIVNVSIQTLDLMASLPPLSFKT